MSENPGLASASGARIALKSVHIEGRLDGLLAAMAITQRYRNDSGKKLEIVYTFPLAWGATLLGMDVTLGGRRLQASVMEKTRAWKRYEAAIDDGDAPVMVERSASGLYTANLGNIEDGEDVTVELRYAQLARVEQGRTRLTVPCVLAPRYGDPHGEGGLAPHESGAADPLAEYPLTIRIALEGPAAKAVIQSPSHIFSVRDTQDGLAVLVNAGAMLDRDFVLTLDGLEERSFALVSPDSGGYMVLAGFRPDLPLTHEPLRMKILADCSGSMAGDSIAQARRALQGVLLELTAKDYVSYSRFGDTVFHEFGAPLPCREEILERLAVIVAGMQADMGGTQMEKALLSTFNDMTLPEGESPPPCVLLITDGDIWNVDQLIRASRNSGQRVFAVGVGSAPAESLLRELARETGGACELVSPNEDIEAAIARMVRRMRGARAMEPRIDWGGKPLWESALPAHFYDDDTVHAFAFFAEEPARPPALYWNVGGREWQLSPETVSRAGGDAVARLGGAARMAEAGTPEAALELALKYQLVSERSALFLTHVREGEKDASFPVPHQVPQMLAAGHQGFGSVARVRHAMPASVGERGLGAGPSPVPIEDLELPAYTRRQTPAARVPDKIHLRSIFGETDRKDSPLAADAEGKGLGAGHPPKNWKMFPGQSGLTYQETFAASEKCLDSLFEAFPEFSLTPLELLRKLNKQSLQETDGLHVMRLIMQDTHQHPMVYALSRISRELRLSPEHVVALLLAWLQIRFKDSFTLSRQAERLLRSLLNAIPDKVKNVAAEALAEEFFHAGKP